MASSPHPRQALAKPGAFEGAGLYDGLSPPYAARSSGVQLATERDLETVPNDLASTRHESEPDEEPPVTRATGQSAPTRWFAWIVRHPHVIALSLLSLSVAALYVLIGFVEHMGYRTALLDLGIYDQATRAYADLRLPRVPLFGIRTPTDLGLLHWTDHFTPILAIVAPFYWLHDGPETLLVVHGLLFALAVPAIWLFARRALGTPSAYLTAAGFALFWPLQHAVFIPFHQVAFAVPLLAWMLERYQVGALRQASVLAALLLLVREDLGLVLSVFGLLVALRGERRLGAGLAVGGVVFVWLATALIIPLMGGSPRRDWTYWHFGRNPVALAGAILKDPIAAMEYALTPDAKVHTLLWLLAPLLFLSLRSRLVLLAVPLLAIRMLSNEPNYWSTEFHYNAFVAPILVCAAVDAASRLRSVSLPAVGSFRLGVLLPIALCLIDLLSLHRWPLSRMARSAWWHPRTTDVRNARLALQQVPRGALVASANTLGIHLTRWAKVTLWVPPGDRREVEAVWKLEGIHWRYVGDRKLAEAPWVVADIERIQFPFASVSDQKKAVRDLVQSGYRIVHNYGGFVVLHRKASGRVASRAVAMEPSSNL